MPDDPAPASNRPYDPGNIFARIIAGQIPSAKVYEDEHTLVIMDAMPQAEGHTLVIPKAPSRGLMDASPATLARLLPMVQRVARAVKAACKADGITIMQFNEPAGGQTVFHLHVHVIPRHEGVPLKSHGRGMEPLAVLQAHAERVRAALNVQLDAAADPSLSSVSRSPPA